jgi:hypothetical protein
MTWFDKIPAKYRHLLIVLGVSVLGAAALVLQQNTDTILSEVPDAVDPFVAGLIGYALLWVTKITKQYGVGSDTTDDPAHEEPVLPEVDPAVPVDPEPVVEPVEAPVDVPVDVPEAPAGD